MDDRSEVDASLVARIAIDAERCIGSGECVWAAPAYFELTDRDVARVRRAGGERRLTVAELELIIENCPSMAISLTPGVSDEPRKVTS